MESIIWQSANSIKPPEDFVEQLCARLAGRVEAAYLFGSYGTPAYRPGSDIDLILVTQTDRPFVERPQQFGDLYRLFPNLDLLVYRREELASLLREKIGFWASVKSSLRELPGLSEYPGSGSTIFT